MSLRHDRGRFRSSMQRTARTIPSNDNGMDLKACKGIAAMSIATARKPATPQGRERHHHQRPGRSHHHAARCLGRAGRPDPAHATTTPPDEMETILADSAPRSAPMARAVLAWFVRRGALSAASSIASSARPPTTPPASSSARPDLTPPSLPLSMPTIPPPNPRPTPIPGSASIGSSHSTPTRRTSRRFPPLGWSPP